MTLSDQIERLRPFVSTHKQELIEKVLDSRTRQVALMLEDIYQPQNASATLRTCECLGVQDVYIAAEKHEFETSMNVVQGANKWLTLHHFDAISHTHPVEECLMALKDKHYRLIATSPAPEAIDLKDIKVDGRMAFIFGTEMTGISEKVRAEAHELVRIPMFGFTESYNLSVSVAMVLHSVLPILRRSQENWGLSEIDKNELRLDWYRKVVRGSDLILNLPE